MRGFLVSVILSVCVPLAFASNGNLAPLPMAGKNPANKKAMQVNDVLSRVQLLSDELAVIWKSMGKPPYKALDVYVSGANLREASILAQSMYQKANRLAFEVTGRYEASSQLNTTRKITASDVWLTINNAYKRILEVKHFLHINGKVSERIFPVSTKPSQIFEALILLNDRLNQMTFSVYSPAEVFQVVTKIIEYNQSILAQFPSVKQTIPDANAFNASKTPKDVYGLLKQCQQLMHEVMKKAGLGAMQIRISLHGSIKPSNVYDFATILLSEAQDMYMHLPASKQNLIISYYPGYKVPAQVYQQVTVLHKQLLMLNKLVNKGHLWFKAK